VSTVFATGADEAYGYHLLNLLGSLKANSDVFDRVVAFDVGLTRHQRHLLDMVPGVEVRTVPPFVEHWRQGFTWKTWVWLNLDAEHVFWLDAGATLLSSLAPVLDQIREYGYFLVSQGGELRDIVPPDYLELYDLPRAAVSRPYVAAGIIGFDTSGAFYDRVIVPTYEDCVRGRNLGFSANEAVSRNYGLAHVDEPIIRNSPQFRWDQTVLNIHIAKEFPDAAVNDLRRYAGVRSPHEHPDQVIWAHRRTGSLSYLKRLPYEGQGAARGRAFGAYWQMRWWVKLHGKYLRRSTYVLKASRTFNETRTRLRG
jgi:hypothetical protein